MKTQELKKSRTQDNELLIIKKLKVEVEGKEILKGVDLEVARGEVVALMGPNGSGKSSFSNTLMGNPNYKITEGEIFFEGKKINEMSPDERANLGIFMAFQYPVSIPGVTVREMLIASMRSKGQEVKALDVKRQVEEVARELRIGDDLLSRGLNEGFSGGEKKKMEILQMKVLQPKLAILDETDSGLDMDALNFVAYELQRQIEQTGMSVILITHYQKMLSLVEVDKVVVLKKGLLVDKGGKTLIAELGKNGYKKYE
jgi:Fe-S cluster assembly ATP-binding protein